MFCLFHSWLAMKERQYWTLPQMRRHPCPHHHHSHHYLHGEKNCILVEKLFTTNVEKRQKDNKQKDKKTKTKRQKQKDQKDKKTKRQKGN